MIATGFWSSVTGALCPPQ